MPDLTNLTDDEYEALSGTLAKRREQTALNRARDFKPLTLRAGEVIRPINSDGDVAYINAYLTIPDVRALIPLLQGIVARYDGAEPVADEPAQPIGSFRADGADYASVYHANDALRAVVSLSGQLLISVVNEDEDDPNNPAECLISIAPDDAYGFARRVLATDFKATTPDAAA